MGRGLLLCLTLLPGIAASGDIYPHKPVPPSGAHFSNTPYTEQKVVFDFYFDDPHKITAAMQWVRALMKPLVEPPHDYPPEFLNIKVVIHGTEIVALARKNYKEYRDTVERMRYYASIGVDFRVCALALDEFAYRPEDMQDFVIVVPSAITELAHWQLKGFALITPQILEKKFSNEEIR